MDSQRFRLSNVHTDAIKATFFGKELNVVWSGVLAHLAEFCAAQIKAGMPLYLDLGSDL